MTTTLQKQAWQSGLVLVDDTEEWNERDWPPLEGGWRMGHASVVLNHTDNNQEQTVVVLGGYQAGQGSVDSILVLNLAESNKQWREGPPMNKKRCGHAAVVCKGGVYVVGGEYNNSYSSLNCIERIDYNDLLQPILTSSSTHESHWTTLTCRLSTGGCGCCAIAVHNRYIVVMGGYNDRCSSSVDIVDTRNETVTAGPSMTVPRQLCASAAIGHRIFLVGGQNESGNLDSVEYIDFAMICDNEKTRKETGSTFISFSPTWTTHSELGLSNASSFCAIVAVGSCLVVAGEKLQTLEVLDTHRNRVWNLPPFGHDRDGSIMVTAANQVAVISGFGNPSCATLGIIDKNTWCFRRLCEQEPSGW